MKYDGYYILSDWLEIPNLRQKSSALLSRTMSHWLLGLPGRADPFLPTSHRWLFVFYSLAAPIYRWIVTLSIFWFLYRILEPYGIQIIGQMLAMIAILGLVVMPLRQAFRSFSVPGRWSAVNRTRFSVCLSAIGAVVLGILFIPLPHEIRCSFYMQPAEARNVYVEQGGIVTAFHVAPGQVVTAGQPLVTLASPELERELTSTAGELLSAEATFLVTQNGASTDDQIARELPIALAAFKTASEKLTERQRDYERLIVRSPADGVLLMGPKRQKADPDADKLDRWHGSPLDSRNLGAFFEPQTIVGKIVADHSKMQAVLAVDQGDIEFVIPDQPVKLWIRQVPGVIFFSETETVSAETMEDIPPSLSTRFGGDIVATADAAGRERPQSTIYQVSADLTVPDQSLLSGATGIAKIRVGSQTLAQRLWRAFMKTFRFEL
jgi:putative peptide zinc metalloprotease protein